MVKYVSIKCFIGKEERYKREERGMVFITFEDPEKIVLYSIYISFLCKGE